jgi:endonuclease I
MKTTIVYSAWTSYLASRLPCPLTSYSFSKEHVVPRSLFPQVVLRKVVDDPRNIIPMPRSLNNARGSLPYTADYLDGFAVYACDKCPMPGYCRGAGIKTPEGFFPPDALKGPVARSVLYSVGRYPFYAHKIDKEVLRIDTAIDWDSRFPMSVPEQAYIESNSSSE